MRRLCVVMTLCLILAGGMPAVADDTKAPGRATILAVFSGFPTDPGTSDPFDASPLLGVSVEHVLAKGLGVGVSLRYSTWKDYMGMYYNVVGIFCGAWTFKTWSPSVFLSYHFSDAGRRVFDPYIGLGVGIRFCSFSNELTDYPPTEASNLDAKPFLRGFAGARVYPFPRARGFMRNFGFMVQADYHTGKDFTPFTMKLGICQGF